MGLETIISALRTLRQDGQFKARLRERVGGQQGIYVTLSKTNDKKKKNDSGFKFLISTRHGVTHPKSHPSGQRKDVQI